MLRKLSVLFFSAITIILLSSWGFFAHKKISRMAVFSLPAPMIKFYKSNIDYITEHAVDPDKRRYVNKEEAAKHYLDADHYGGFPFDSIPQQWDEAVLKYGEDTLKAHGIVPWQIQRTYYSLVKAFKERDAGKILRHSCDLTHYIADAHIPLHTTSNYNGQFTNQVGIHGFLESRLPELFTSEYDFFVGKAKYIDNPLKEAWKFTRHTFSLTDSVFLIEARLSKSFPSDRKYAFSERNGILLKQYSEEYSRAYHTALNGMVEKQMQQSILVTASYWYSAWVDAGQPNLNGMKSEAEAEDKKEELLYQEGKQLGRPE